MNGAGRKRGICTLVFHRVPLSRMEPGATPYRHYGLGFEIPRKGVRKVGPCFQPVCDGAVSRAKTGWKHGPALSNYRGMRLNLVPFGQEPFFMVLHGGWSRVPARGGWQWVC